MNPCSLAVRTFRHFRITPVKKQFLREHIWSIFIWPAVCLGTGVLLLLLLLSLLNSTRRNLEDRALAMADVLAGTYAQQIGRTIGELDRMTNLLKNIWESSEGEFRLEDFQQKARFIDTSSVGISITDRNGIVVSSTMPNASGMSVKDRDYFKFHQSDPSAALHIARPLAGRLADKEIIVFSRRLSLPNGEFGGVITASTGTAILAAFADRSILGSTGLLALVGLDGQLRIARVGGTVESVLHPKIIRDPAFAAEALVHGASQPDWFSDNVVRYLASAPVPGYPLRAVVGLGQSDVFAPLVAEKSRYFQIGIAASVVLLLFSFIATIMTLRLAWRKHSAEAIRNTYRVATEGANEGFYMWRPVYGKNDRIVDFEMVDCNERGAELYGRTRAELSGRRLSALYTDSRQQEMIKLGAEVMAAGYYEDEYLSTIRETPAWIHRKFVRTGDSVAVTLRDISKRKQAEQEKQLMAERDNLTGLPNRHWLASYLPLAIERAASGKNKLAAFFIDLDKFKVVNDSWGHSTGDKLLREVAERMQAVLRPTDRIARFGGDEFIVLLECIEQENDAAEVAQRIADVLEQPFHIDQRECLVGASIGISLYPTDGTEAETLIRNADIAMYNAKSDSKSRYHFFKQELFARIQSHWEIERELVHALENDEFVIYYQPRVDALSGQLAGLEALVRWAHPVRGLVYPGDFISIAESSGLILRLGEIVMKKVCLQLAQWRTEGMELVPVSVNMSGKQFNEGSVKDILACYALQHELPAALIEIELTESIMITNEQQVAEELTALRAMGVTVHLDDFGTGYSSLSMLHKLDVDVLKVDRAFTSQLGVAEEGELLFKAIISMARALGMRVVAEGVETEEQLRILQSLGCDEIQGYLVSKPIPAAEIPAFHFSEEARTQ